MTADPLVGRAREIALLERRLEAARAGSGASVLVEGEAGAGKTALANELVHRARRAGMRAAWGACLEGEGAAPYWPWLQILRELGESGTSLLNPTGGEAGNRYHIFDDIVIALRRAAKAQGLLVVVDDLHWADVPSMRLAQAVAAVTADTGLLFVGLYRGREVYPYPDIADGLRAMRRERATTMLTLGGLAPDEVAELATRRLGRAADEDLLRGVLDRAEGNPLFVLELLRLVEAPGRFQPRLPESIGEVIGSRLDQLPATTRAVLRLAAVIGREFTVAMLAAVAEQSPTELSDALDETVAAEVAALVDAHTYRFTHVLIQEVLYAELPTALRLRSHALAAQALRPTDGGPRSIEALAHHLRQALPIVGAPAALEMTLSAAVRARHQLAYEHAAFQYGEALTLLPLLPGDDGIRAELLLDLARCQFRSGAVELAWLSCQAAADIGRAAGDGALVADAAIVLQGVKNSPLTKQIHGMCRDALAMLGEADRLREAKVLAQLAITADPFASTDAGGASQRALQLAEASGDPDARFLALAARHTDLLNVEHVLERLSIGERAVRLGAETGRAEYTAWGRSWRLECFAELGRRAQFDAELAAFAAVVAQLKEPLWMWRLTTAQAMLAQFEGRFEAARSLADQALQIGLRGGHRAAEHFDLVFSSNVAAKTGDGLAEVETGVRAFVATGPHQSRAWLIGVLLPMGRRDEAAALWEAIVPEITSLPRHAPEWLPAITEEAKLCAVFDDRATAAKLYDVLLPYADRHLPYGGPVALSLGMVATLLDDWGAAEVHLRSALSACRATGSPPYEAETHLSLARLLSRCRKADPAIDAHLEQAMSIARHLGMKPLLAEATELREALRRSPAGVLSTREEQVASLVAQGLSNRQIATRLHLSERTVENHVTHILTKLGFESRARIAAWHATRTAAG